jgi:mono/diheme cytochrome c family protein
MRAITSASLLAALLVAAGAARAQNIDRGRLLYDTHCATCHTERLHTREKSVIQSYGALRAEVGKRAGMTNRQFSPDELEDIIEFLDRSHYRLDVPRRPPPPAK